MKCVLIGGVAGVGKTTLCNQIDREIVVLRKDELTSTATSSLLCALGQPESDRESSVYLEKVRPIEYHLLTQAALCCVQAGDVVVEAPWLLEMSSKKWVTEFRQEVEQRGGSLLCVWLVCETQTNHERLQARGAARDNGKLDNWQQYLKDSGRWISEIPQYADFVLDTTNQTPLELASKLRKYLS